MIPFPEVLARLVLTVLYEKLYFSLVNITIKKLLKSSLILLVEPWQEVEAWVPPDIEHPDARFWILVQASLQEIQGLLAYACFLFVRNNERILQDIHHVNSRKLKVPERQRFEEQLVEDHSKSPGVHCVA